MALSLKELIITYQANAAPVIDALNKIDAKLKTTSQQLNAVSDSFTRAGRDLALTISLPLFFLGKSALKASADFETLRMQMDILTGSAEKGKEIFDKLVKFAAATPFELSQLTSATNVLMGFGETADDAFKHIGLLGDVAASVNADMNRLAFTFGSASAEGKLMTKDIRELINNGIPATKLLAETMGVPMAKVFELAEQGKITFAVLVKAFEDATRKGGMFEDGMAKLSRTLHGVNSTFRDNVNIALATFGDELVKTLGLIPKLQAFGEWIGRVAENFKRLSDENKKTIILVGLFITALAPTLILIGGLIRLFGLAILAVRGLWAAILLLGNGFRLLIVPVRAFMLLMAANPLVAFLTATALIITYWKEIVQLFKDAWGWISKITGSKEDMANRQKNIDYSPTDFKPLFSSIGSGIVGGVDSFNNFLAQRSLLPESFKTGGAFNNPTNNTNKTNNLTFNFAAGTSASDAKSIEEAVKNALGEANKNAYMELGI